MAREGEGRPPDVHEGTMRATWEPELIDVPGGTFVMGDAWGDGERDEAPAFSLDMEPFALGKYAVTNRQFLAFLNDRGYHCDEDGRVLISLAAARNPIFREGDRFACRPGSEELPVTFVAWTGAHAYVRWL